MGHKFSEKWAIVASITTYKCSGPFGVYSYGPAVGVWSYRMNILIQSDFHTEMVSKTQKRFYAEIFQQPNENNVISLFTIMHYSTKPVDL